MNASAVGARTPLAELLESVRSKAAETYSSVEFTLLATDDLVATADPGFLGVALAAVVENAAVYTPAGGSVTIRVARHRGVAVIDVDDTGIGMNSDEQERAFEAHYRAPGAVEIRPLGEGYGLGTARTIVEELGGWIGITSVEEIGTTVRIELPLPLEA